jgi:hypothetical protein
MRVLLPLLLVVVLVVALVGCGQPTPAGPPLTDATNAPDETSARPRPTLATTPAPGTGLVTGVALLEGEDNQPATGIDLFLAEVSEAVEGQMSLAMLDPASSPKTAASDEGTFVFNNVSPGTYVLVAYVSPADSAVVPNAENGKELIISVEPNQVVDLGPIYVPKLY